MSIKPEDLKQIEETLAKCAVALNQGDYEEQEVGKALVAAADKLKTKRETKPFDDQSNIMQPLPPRFRPSHKFIPRQ